MRSPAPLATLILAPLLFAGTAVAWPAAAPVASASAASLDGRVDDRAADVDRAALVDPPAAPAARSLPRAVALAATPAPLPGQLQPGRAAPPPLAPPLRSSARAVPVGARAPPSA